MGRPSHEPEMQEQEHGEEEPLPALFCTFCSLACLTRLRLETGSESPKSLTLPGC